MKYLLSVPERLAIVNSLPREGDIIKLMMMRQLKDKIGLTDEETEKYGVTVNKKTQRLSWDETKIEDVEIDIGPKGVEIIQATLRSMSDRGVLPMAYIELYDKFVGLPKDAKIQL
jgi:hypothetical protein